MKPVAEPRGPAAWLVWTGLVALLGWRAWQVLHTGAGLHVDEAQYWYWSKDLQWGYFSKPPLLVALIRASTVLLGDGLLGVKLLAMVCWLLASLMLWRLGVAMGRERAGAVAGALLAASPASGLLGLSVTTDAPLVLFWSGVMHGAWRAAQARGWQTWLWWGLTGLALGLAVLSKYTALVLAVSALWLVWCAPAADRVRVLQGAALAALVAACVVSPHLWWNAQNGWPTWKHTVDITLQAPAHQAVVSSGVGFRTVQGARSVLEFALGQLLLLGPAALGVGLWCVGRRRVMVAAQARTAGSVWSVMTFVWAFVWPLLLVGLLQAARSKAQVNWSLPALLGVCLLLGLWAQRVRLSRGWVIGWVLLGVVVSSAVALGGDLRSWGGAPVAGRQTWDIWGRMRGWHEALGALRPALQAHAGEVWVLSDRTQLVQVAYELRELQPQLRSWSPSGNVRHHFDWKQPFRPEQLAPGASVLFIGSGVPPASLLAQLPVQTAVAQAQSGRVALQVWRLSRAGESGGKSTP